MKSTSSLYIILFSFFLLVTAPVYAQLEESDELIEIEFSGNRAFNSATLTEVILSEESPAGVWQFLNSFTSLGSGPVYFKPADVQVDRNALESYYFANGYFEISVGDSVFRTEEGVVLKYYINEGPRFRYRKIEITGLDKYSFKYKINENITIDSADFFSQSEVISSINSMVYAMINDGYMNAKFDSIIIYQDTVENLADVFLDFTLGKRYKIGKLKVNKDGEGSDKVSAEMLKELSDIRKGDYYSVDEIKQAQMRLYRTDLFTRVNVGVDKDNTENSTVPLIINGNIGPLIDIGPEIIANNEQNAFNIGLALVYNQNNFLGNARRLTAESSFGIQDIINIDYSNFFDLFDRRDTTVLGYYELTAGVEQPYLFQEPIFGRLELFNIMRKYRQHSEIITGGEVNLEFEMPRHTFITYLEIFYTIEYNEYNIINEDESQNTTSSIIGGETRSTKVNNIIFPSSGYNLIIAAEQGNSIPYLISSVSGSDLNFALFYKLLLTTTGYFSLNSSNSLVLALKNKTGHIQTYLGPSEKLPINRTFYSGGSNSIRGWGFRELVPGGINEDLTSDKVSGGQFLLESSVELRWRLADAFGMVFFTDAGNTWKYYDIMQLEDAAVASGFGFRFYTSFVAFRVDFGVKMHDPYNKGSILNKPFFKQMEFHFGIGEAF